MARRDRQKEIAAETGSSADYDEYKRQRNRISSLLKNAENHHYEQNLAGLSVFFYSFLGGWERT